MPSQPGHDSPVTPPFNRISSDATLDIAGVETQLGLRVEFDRIATRLHDQVLQDFAVCAIKSQMCQRLVELGRFGEVENELLALEEAVNTAIDRLRDVVGDLRQRDGGKNSGY